MGSPGEHRRLFPALEARRDVKHGEVRLMAEVMLASRHGKLVSFEAALKAEDVLQTLARS